MSQGFTTGQAVTAVGQLMGDAAPVVPPGTTFDALRGMVKDAPITSAALSPCVEQPSEALAAPQVAARVAKKVGCEVSAVDGFTYVRVTSAEGGETLVHEPKGARQINLSPDRDVWLEASRAAWHALKVIPGNKYVRLDEAEEGAPVFDCVTACRVKKHGRGHGPSRQAIGASQRRRQAR